MSMTIRPYRRSDRAALLAIHERQAAHEGIPLLFNDPDDPQQFSTIVAVEDNWIVGAATARRLAEGATILNPAFGGRGSDGPVRRWMLLSELIRHGARVAWENGYTELMAATPPGSRGYTARLVRELGFTLDGRNRLYLDLDQKYGREKMGA